jgi:tyrosyl-tRNA synthetase
MTLRRFQLSGHRVIALVGGATGLIGDPSGRSTERNLQDDDVVKQWLDNIRTQLGIVLDFEGDAPAAVVSNYDWTAELSAIDLLRDIGKHFSVNQMLAKDSVSTRLAGEGISYTEFSYMVLQANDYLELYRSRDCVLQVGGADQWGNITAGLDLIRRVTGHDGPKAHALTVPLVTKSDGSKFGKTAGGAIWLSADMTSPYAFYQFWINTDDRDIARFLRMFSLKSHVEIEALEAEGAQRPAARIPQRALAAELTALIHSPAEAERVEEASRALFGRGDVATLDGPTLTAALTEAPHANTTDSDVTVVDALVAAGLCETKGAARRTITEGGAYVNNVRVADLEMRLNPDVALADGWVLLRRGKKSIAGIRFAALGAEE